MPNQAPQENVILGLWPLAGITTVGVTDRDRDETLAAAIDAGIRGFDTAYSYGTNGESDRWLGRHVADRDDVWIVGKIAQRYVDGQRVIDARPETLVRDAETSLRRIGKTRFDELLLHSPDPNVPIERSAEAMASLIDRGLATHTGVCNASIDQIKTFARVVRPYSIQCGWNLLQTDNAGLIAWAADHDVRVYVFWTLMKGLLAGRIGRDHVFAPGDSRPQYDIFRGAARRRAHRVVDALVDLARQHQTNVASLSIGWALSTPGVTAALVGARTRQQIEQTAAATPLAPPIKDAIDQIVAESEHETA